MERKQVLRVSVLLWYGVATLVVVLDQWSKTLASARLDYAVPVPVLPVFNLTLHHNQGAAFSFLSDAGGWQRWLFTGISAAVSVVLLIWIARLGRGERLLAAALALILGGAIGNLIDRVLFGYVVDFVSLHWRGWYFPTFNVADAAITVGAALMLLDMFVSGDEDRNNGPERGRAGESQ